MAYDDRRPRPGVADAERLATCSPGFYGGDYAMYVGGNFIAQQLVESAPEGFDWVVLPPLAGTEGANQAANPQTLSVSAESEHVEEAAAFIDFFMSAENLAALAEGDWLIPASAAAARGACSRRPAARTAGTRSWPAATCSSPPRSSPSSSYPQWKDQIATPALQQYLADAISLEDLQPS